MDIATATRIAREFGLNLANAGGNRYVLLEARHVTLTPRRAARISLAEWRITCSNIAHRA